MGWDKNLLNKVSNDIRKTNTATILITTMYKRGWLHAKILTESDSRWLHHSLIHVAPETKKKMANGSVHARVVKRRNNDGQIICTHTPSPSPRQEKPWCLTPMVGLEPPHCFPRCLPRCHFPGTKGTEWWQFQFVFPFSSRWSCTPSGDVWGIE